MINSSVYTDNEVKFVMDFEKCCQNGDFNSIDTFKLGNDRMEGSFRYCYKTIATSGQYRGWNIGVKVFKEQWKRYSPSQNSEEVNLSKFVRNLTEKFNKVAKTTKPIYCVVPVVFKRCDGLIFTIEPFLSGKFEKFNNNSTFVSDPTISVQALSHFSYAFSNKKYLLCDLQGVRYDDKYILTDPVIITKKGVPGTPDLGKEGMKVFFGGHKCNRFCQILGITNIRPKMKQIAPKWNNNQNILQFRNSGTVYSKILGYNIPLQQQQQFQKFQGLIPVNMMNNQQQGNY